MKYLIGLDNGGTVTKAALFDTDGRQLAVAKAEIPMICPAPGITERRMEELWAANLNVLKAVTKQAGRQAADIAAIGLSGHGKGLYLLDRKGREFRNGIVSTDNRAADIAQKFQENGVAERIRKLNFQRVLACQPVCLLRWLKENRPEEYNRIGSVLSVKDYIRYKLTGHIFAERTDLSGSNLFNLTTGKKDRALLAQLGIEEMFDCIPSVKSADEHCGTLSEAVAEEIGLPKETVVAGGMFDIDACALSVGLLDEQDVCVIAGTWSINEYLSDHPVNDGSVSMNSYAFLPGRYLVEECSPTSAGNLDWVLGTFGIEKDFKALDREIARIRPQDCKVLFLPFLFASNEKNEKIKSCFVGMGADTTQEEIVRSVYEGIVFAHKTHLDRLLSSRPAPRAVRLTGGASGSPVWAQMFADVFDLRVEVVEDREHGCLGSALAAGIACGLYPSYREAVERTRTKEKVYLPVPEAAAEYEKKYRRYRQLVEALNPFFGGERHA